MMSLLSPSFLLGSLFLLYLLSFVVFAIIRIATGVSIQRIGYFSLRRIAYTPREGIRIEIRSLGLILHRPSFAQPTWISVRIKELKVTIDIKVIKGRNSSNLNPDQTQDASQFSTDSGNRDKLRRKGKSAAPRSQLWRRLTRIKEQLKSLHQNIHWLCLVDVVASDSILAISDTATFEIGALTAAIDTRRQTVDRGRLFQHKKVPAGDQRPAEWIITIRGVLYTPSGKEPLEIVDNCSLNVHGLLYKEKAGLRDASIALKLGRIHIPYDDMVACHDRIQRLGKYTATSDLNGYVEGKLLSAEDILGELDQPDSKEESIVQTVSDSKEFLSSILRGIQEIQMAISFVGLSKHVQLPGSAGVGIPVYLNFVMNEFGIDMHRLDSRSPAHRMYFAPKDVAHQALLAAISMSVSLDDDTGKPERIAYIPMATATIKSTLPSKSVLLPKGKDIAERNANILYANLVVTSPSVDVDPNHMPWVLALIQLGSRITPSTSSYDPAHHHIVRKLLPKASVKFSIHEPVLRVVLPTTSGHAGEIEDYDLLICSIASVYLDLESSHSSASDFHYSLILNLRVSSHQFYYQNNVGERHDLFVADAAELKTQIEASPEVCVDVIGKMQTFSVHMNRPEISTGVRQIMLHLKQQLNAPGSTSIEKQKKESFLRTLPPWLAHVQLQGSNFGVEVAGIDEEVSRDTRGLALQLETWTAEYKVRKSKDAERPASRHRSASKSKQLGEPAITITPPDPGPNQSITTTDGRRLAIHIKGFDGFVVEGLNVVEPESFISLPRGEVAFSTSSDSRGRILHLNTQVKALYVHYSLYRSYAAAIALVVLRNAFVYDCAERPNGRPTRGGLGTLGRSLSNPATSKDQGELFTIDFKADLMQLKATLPSEPHMMLQIYALEAGRHRWAAPFIRSRLGRVHVQAPQVKFAWARIMSMKNLRLDLRESRRRQAHKIVEERSFDIASEYTRIAVPHQLVPHTIFDNLVNCSKCTEQLYHRFLTGTNEYILEKGPEGPKKVPRISLRSRILAVELEDGPFEWKLGSIYRAGLIEQKQRLAREEAFEAKVQNVEKMRQRRGSSLLREASPYKHRRNGSRSEASDNRRPSDHRASDRAQSRDRPKLQSDTRNGRLRYDPDGQVGMSETSEVSEKEARYKLQLYNAQCWKRRIDAAYRRQNKGIRDMRRTFWGADDLSHLPEGDEDIVSMPERPGLLTAWINDFHLSIDKPSFAIEDFSTFIHRVGKGMPKDMQYSLLIPCHLHLAMGETRVSLRDYPLPLLHVPTLRAGQSSRLPSWSLETDFVIAEEFRGPASIKRLHVEVMPKSKVSYSESPGPFVVDVQRTVSPVKTYSDIEISVNTNAPTSIMWGTSYQPAIQDSMMIVEGFTKPQIDPSDRIGFWDKIRLNFHSRVNVMWNGDGDVHFRLKGSRDPYIVTGYGAGFVMCWRNNVRWEIHRQDDPKKFMSVTSGEYILAIPDYSHEARRGSVSPGQDSDSLSSASSSRGGAMFKKVIMKLSGNVQWLAGLVLERDIEEGGRSFAFTPHYDVVLTTPGRAKAPDEQVECSDTSMRATLTIRQAYDAFRGFRSNYIHLSIAIVAPLDRNWSVTNTTPSDNYNTIHLTPRFFTHFFDWWSLFSGVMSLPIRQGRLFPGVDKASKKFGRHLATLKYNLLLSPLFITHLYIHKDAEDYSQDILSATGLKVRINSFMLDLHQRREEFAALGRGYSKQIRSSGMRINQAQLDLLSADVRAISASISGTSAQDLDKASDADLAAYSEPATIADVSRFIIPDNDLSWIDMDDFVEIDWILPVKTNPETKIMPLAFAPHFTYFRQTDHGDSISGDTTRTSPFGNEPTHLCIMTQDNNPREVQGQLVSERVKKINEQLTLHKRTLGEQELRVVRDGNRDSSLKARFEKLKDQGQKLEAKKKILMAMLERLTSRAGSDPWSYSGGNFQDHESFFDASVDNSTSMDPVSIKDFNNRFIIHNAQLKWNNSLRNITLRYVHQVSQRRGFIYYMTRRAVKFILDIIQDQRRKHGSEEERSGTRTPTSATLHEGLSEHDLQYQSIEERIQNLLKDENRSVDADDSKGVEGARNSAMDETQDGLSEDFTPVNSYHLRLIAPQIQLQSEKNPKWVVLVTAKSMQLKVVQIMDSDRMADDVSGLVQRRFSVEMDSVQFFVSNHQTMMQFLHFYSENRYGSPKGSAWPPWVPFEVNFDFQLNPFGFARVVQRTSASLRYDKYNTLRLKFNDDIRSNKAAPQGVPNSIESKIDHLRVDFPRVRAICDSAQYFTIYVIIADLLLYSEPLEKIRSERLEKIMFASDFSDLSGAPEMVVNLQEKIRQLEEIKTQFQIRSMYLDRKGWQDRLTVEEDLAACEDELFFMMKAITTSQRKSEERNQTSQTSGLLRWNLSASEIVWHLMRDKNEPMMEIQLQKAVYDRTDNTDGSNHNSMEVDRIYGLNLLPHALYPQMISPYFGNAKSSASIDDIKMLSVHWHMLEAIAGIPVLDNFEVNLFPLKIQLERDIGKKLFEYIFPGHRTRSGGAHQESPFQIKHALPEQDEGDGSDIESQSRSKLYGSESDTEQDLNMINLEKRLRPTKKFDTKKNDRLRPTKSRKSTASNHEETYSFRMYHRPGGSELVARPKTPGVSSRQSSLESLPLSRKSHETSSTSLSAMNGVSEKHKKFVLNRTNSKDVKDKEQPADDLTRMMSRASNYMTLAYVKVPSVVLCVSYKGRGERNWEDINDFVFRMPALEYRNKTWSNLDLALRLKKDVIKALISHTGAIIGNKFTRHKPSIKTTSRLRELAHASVILPNTNNLLNVSRKDDSNALRSQGYDSDTPPRSSISTSSFVTGTDSDTSSLVHGTMLRSGNNRPDGSSSDASAEDGLQERGAASERPHFLRQNTLTHSNLVKRFTSDSTARNGPQQESTEGDGDDGGKKKGVFLLGKRILGQLNDH